MSSNFKIESTIVVNGRSFARATAVAGRLASAASTPDSRISSELRSDLKRLANRTFSVIETNIAQVTGSKKIAEQSGRGLQVDLITVNLRDRSVSVQEVKGSLIQSITKGIKGVDQLSLSRDSEIGLGSAIRIGNAGQKMLTTGYTVDSQGAIYEQVEQLTETEKFYKLYNGKEDKLRAHLKAPSKQRNLAVRKILEALRTNLETKALTVTIPFNINENQTGITTLKFTRKYILENADIKFNTKDKTIDITFGYKQGIINTALKKVQKDPAVVKAYSSDLPRDIGKFMDDQLDSLKNSPDNLAYFKRLVNSIERVLNTENSKANVIAFSGSILAYKGRINVLEPEKRRDMDPDIPVIMDITTLVQGRTRLRMRRGSGEPYPSKIYERSGTFRQSIEAYADFRTNIVNYFYAPYYDSLERYGYEIQDLVEGSIRSVTQQRFNRQFNLVKRNT